MVIEVDAAQNTWTSKKEISFRLAPSPEELTTNAVNAPARLLENHRAGQLVGEKDFNICWQ